MDDYPSYAFGDVLNALSDDGKYFAAPSDYNSSEDWKWKIKAEFRPALKQILQYYCVGVVDD